MKQFENAVITGVHEGRDDGRVKALRPGASQEFLHPAEVRQKMAHDAGCHGKRRKAEDFVPGEGTLRQGGVNIEAPVRGNAAKNGFGADRVKAYRGNVIDDAQLRGKIGAGYNIITANIVADIVILLCDDIKNYMNDGAVFITSGIIIPREQDVLDAFERNGLAVIERRESGGWLCFEVKAK